MKHQNTTQWCSIPHVYGVRSFNKHTNKLHTQRVFLSLFLIRARILSRIRGLLLQADVVDACFYAPNNLYVNWTCVCRLVSIICWCVMHTFHVGVVGRSSNASVEIFSCVHLCKRNLLIETNELIFIVQNFHNNRNFCAIFIVRISADEMRVNSASKWVKD